MIDRRTLSIAVVVSIHLLIRPVFADTALTALQPAPATPVPAPASGPPLPNSDGKTARIAGKVLVVAGAVAVITGMVLAIHYKKGIGACDASGVCQQQDNRTPLGLGLATVGGIMSMVGACLWFTVPTTNASVGMGPSSLTLAGHF